jgi:pimeloyl-ACP methyl ester carboxylesterase
MTEIQTLTLDVPGAVLTYDVRRNESSTKPVLLMIGSPMGAGGFPTLAGFFSDRTVVTMDPRMSERSHRTDGALVTTVDEQADDLHRLIAALDVGPVDVFASSGAAVTALALVAAHPEQVRTLVAHEPPTAAVLPDAEYALAACRDIHDTYLRRGFGAGMAKFLALVMHQGEFAADYAQRPDPDPAMFGLPVEDDGSRNDPLLGHNVPALNEYVPDFGALRSASTRVVLAAGVDSRGTLAHRGAFAIADRLGRPMPVFFPDGHAGFLGGEYGQTGQPEMFAANLREVLDEA